ncbi:MAG: HNH endonuclease signature motif containing protein [Gemmatimonadaceae bacterium]
MTSRQRYSEDDLNDIYNRTSGKCHICHKRLAFKNYGALKARGAWEVEHSRPLALGGTNHGNNLRPVCLPCNRSKETKGTRTARGWNGRTRAPLSVSKRRATKQERALVGGLVFGTLGALVAGPLGAIAGGVLGVGLGHAEDPDQPH